MFKVLLILFLASVALCTGGIGCPGQNQGGVTTESLINKNSNRIIGNGLGKGLIMTNKKCQVNCLGESYLEVVILPSDTCVYNSYDQICEGSKDCNCLKFSHECPTFFNSQMSAEIHSKCNSLKCNAFHNWNEPVLEDLEEY